MSDARLDWLSPSRARLREGAKLRHGETVRRPDGTLAVFVSIGDPPPAAPAEALPSEVVCGECGHAIDRPTATAERWALWRDGRGGLIPLCPGCAAPRSDWRFVQAGFPTGYVFERTLDDGTHLRVEVRPCLRCGRPNIGPLTIDPGSDAAGRAFALNDLEIAINEVIDMLAIKGNRPLAITCGMAPGKPVRGQRSHSRHPRHDLTEVVEAVLEREAAGADDPLDLSGVMPRPPSRRRVRELMRGAERLGRVKITSEPGRRNRYQRPDAPV